MCVLVCVCVSVCMCVCVCVCVISTLPALALSKTILAHHVFVIYSCSKLLHHTVTVYCSEYTVYVVNTQFM